MACFRSSRINILDITKLYRFILSYSIFALTHNLLSLIHDLKCSYIIACRMCTFTYYCPCCYCHRPSNNLPRCSDYSTDVFQLIVTGDGYTSKGSNSRQWGYLWRKAFVPSPSCFRPCKYLRGMGTTKTC